MILKGERSGSIVFIYPYNGEGVINNVPRDASTIISKKIRDEVCIDCPIYEISCNGIGRVVQGGVIKEGKTGKVVVYEECRIPGSSINYGGFDLGIGRIETNQA